MQTRSSPPARRGRPPTSEADLLHLQESHRLDEAVSLLDRRANELLSNSESRKRMLLDYATRVRGENDALVLQNQQLLQDKLDLVKEREFANKELRRELMSVEEMLREEGELYGKRIRGLEMELVARHEKSMGEMQARWDKEGKEWEQRVEGLERGILRERGELEEEKRRNVGFIEGNRRLVEGKKELEEERRRNLGLLEENRRIMEEKRELEEGKMENTMLAGERRELQELKIRIRVLEVEHQESEELKLRNHLLEEENIMLAKDNRESEEVVRWNKAQIEKCKSQLEEATLKNKVLVAEKHGLDEANAQTNDAKTFEHEETVDELQREIINMRSTLMERDVAIAQVQAERIASVAALRSEHEAYLELVRVQHESSDRALKEDCQAKQIETVTIQAEMDAIENVHQSEIYSIKAEYDARIVQTEAQFEIKEDDLKKTIYELSTELATLVVTVAPVSTFSPLAPTPFIQTKRTSSTPNSWLLVFLLTILAIVIIPGIVVFRSSSYSPIHEWLAQSREILATALGLPRTAASIPT